MFDTIIVGGGIIGCSTAYFLSKLGQKVALFEKGCIAGEQSSRNWGSIRTQARPESEIQMMLNSLKIWEGLEAEIGMSIDWKQHGQMLIAYDEAHLTELESTIPLSKAYNIPSQIISKSKIHEILPHFQSNDCIGALFNPNDGCAEPCKAAPAIAKAAQELGADITPNCAVMKIEIAASKITGVQTENGFVRGNTVVVAAGAWTERLLNPLKLNHPSLWIKGSVARTKPLKIDMRKLVVWGKTAHKQNPDGRLLLAVSEDGTHDIMTSSIKHGLKYLPLAWKNKGLLSLSLGKPFIESLGKKYTDFKMTRTLDPKPNYKGLAKAKSLFLQEFPNVGSIEIESSWAGYIDYMPDALPVIDTPHKIEGLVIAAGFSGNGFAIGPGVGQAISKLITTGDSGLNLKPFSMRRFQ